MKIDLSHLLLLLKRLGISFLMFTICRLLFYLFHPSFFDGDFPVNAFFYGLRFDSVAIAYFFSIFILISSLPFSFRASDWYQKIVKILFHLGNSLAIILNLIDLGYYRYSLKRTTADFFDFLSTGNDFWGMFPQYVLDFWYAFVFLIILIILSEFLYRKTKLSTPNIQYTLNNYLSQTLLFVLVIGTTIIGYRGGIQLKPIDVINAGSYTSPKYVPVVLNTPFCVIKTILNDQLPKVEFYSKEEVETIYSPETTIQSAGKFKGKNVVLIILESFAKEYVGFFNHNDGYTPFLDSLCAESYVFSNAYSNGSRSIEALPSIFTGIPPLMNTPFVISNYSSNKLDAMPQILKKNGYSTSFYHGGANGTMGFDGFANISGVEEYFGMNEYPNAEADYDNHWGIYDEPYLQYFSNELNAKKEPFFSTVFTLSSHHPYSIPEKYKGSFPKGILDAHPTIGYTDYALRQFFNTARKSDWYQNTIFIFTADHSSTSLDPKYSTIIGRFAIPVFIYAPGTQFKGSNNNYFQHCDITPTLLHLLGINTKIISFGLDINKTDRYVVGFSRNTYYYMANNYLLLFDGEKSIGLYNYNNDQLLRTNLLNSSTNIAIQNQLESKLKAIIQQHNNRLIENRLSISNQ